MMKNTYEVEVYARCPVDGSLDRYEFRIEADRTIKAEDIVAFFKLWAGPDQAVFQEALTAKCARALEVDVTSVGWHSGIKVTSSATAP